MLSAPFIPKMKRYSTVDTTKANNFARIYAETGSGIHTHTHTLDSKTKSGNSFKREPESFDEITPTNKAGADERTCARYCSRVRSPAHRSTVNKQGIQHKYTQTRAQKAKHKATFSSSFYSSMNTTNRNVLHNSMHTA